ncbi:MAG TPA: hypothetical protein VK806_11955 [Bacteroidia bacterium]|jgi:hypothetical protein|nr:hypothetical protein [Bacteroidia bacterium]
MIASDNKKTTIIGEKLKSIFKPLEIIFVLAILTGVGLKVMGVSAYLPVLLISCSAIIIVYYMIGITPSSSATKLEAFITKLTFWGGSVAVTGILFCIQNYERAETMLAIGTITLAGVTLYLVVKIQSDFVKANRNMVIRSMILLLICIGLISTPKEQLIALHLMSKAGHYNYTHQDPSLYTPKVVVINSDYKRLTKANISAEIDSFKKNQKDNSKMGLLLNTNTGDDKKRMSFLQNAYKQIDTGTNIYIRNNLISEIISIRQWHFSMNDETYNAAVDSLKDNINKSNHRGDTMKLIKAGIGKYKNKYTYWYTETYYGSYKEFAYGYFLNINDVTFCVGIISKGGDIDFEKTIGVL